MLQWQTLRMKRWMLLGAALPVLVGLAMLLALATALQREPAVSMLSEPDAEDVARALALVRTHDPRRSRPGQVSALRLSEHELEVLLNHAALRRLTGAGNVSLQRGGATVRTSLNLPANPFGRWLNVQAQLVESGGLPVLARLQVGELPLPPWVGEKALMWAARRAGLEEQLLAAADVVQRVSFHPQQLTVVYAWRDDSAQTMLGALVPADQQQRMRAYAAHLAQLVARQPAVWTASLASLVGPMFELARQRSAVPGADAAAENRAALVVLMLFANGRSVEAVLPMASNWPRARPLQLTLDERTDFPRHLLVSAALAAESTNPLARAIGVYKEVADSRGGTGFSFNDMAANRAGIRLGELAVTQPQRLQAALAGGVKDGDLMPRWKDLPEFMNEAEFVRRYGGVGSPAYEEMLAEIDRRVAELSVLR